MLKTRTRPLLTTGSGMSGETVLSYIRARSLHPSWQIFQPYCCSFTCSRSASLSFPILINMGLDQNIWFFVAAYIAGFFGVIMTPVHLCSAMSSDYFGIKTEKLLKTVIIAEAVMLIAVVICLIVVNIYQ